MKLIDFYKYTPLNDLLTEMGANLVKSFNDNEWIPTNDDKLRELIENGEVEVDIDDLLPDKNNILTYKGRKVILYIRDQYPKHHSKGYCFHLSKCSTIRKFIKNNRKSRYVISDRTDGYFKINIIDGKTIIEKDLIKPLKVCKNCLDKINYKDYKGNKEQSKEEKDLKKQIIFNEFNLNDFFSIYKSQDISTTNFRSSNNAPINNYPSNFKEISKKVRGMKNYTCENCGINLSKKEHQKFCHCHHKNADKSNNSLSNLEVLCIECHVKKPMHAYLKISPDYKDFLKVKIDIY